MAPELKAERNDAIRADVAAGMTRRQAAEKYSLPVTSIRKIVLRFGGVGEAAQRGAKPSATVAERNAAMRADYAAGIERRELADKYGVSLGLVRTVTRGARPAASKPAEPADGRSCPCCYKAVSLREWNAARRRCRDCSSAYGRDDLAGSGAAPDYRRGRRPTATPGAGPPGLHND